MDSGLAGECCSNSLSHFHLFPTLPAVKDSRLSRSAILMKAVTTNTIRDISGEVEKWNHGYGHSSIQPRAVESSALARLTLLLALAALFFPSSLAAEPQDYFGTLGLSSWLAAGYIWLGTTQGPLSSSRVLSHSLLDSHQLAEVGGQVCESAQTPVSSHGPNLHDAEDIAGRII